MITPGSYLLQRPQGVNDRLDFLLVVETQEFVHHWFHETTFAVLEEEVEERESSYNFVLLVEFNRIHLLHLPPLEGKKQRSTSIAGESFLFVRVYVSFAMKCSLDSNRLHLWLTDFAKLKKLFVSPVTMFDAPEKTQRKGFLYAGQKWLVINKQPRSMKGEVGEKELAPLDP